MWVMQVIHGVDCCMQQALNLGRVSVSETVHNNHKSPSQTACFSRSTYPTSFESNPTHISSSHPQLQRAPNGLRRRRQGLL